MHRMVALVSSFTSSSVSAVPSQWARMKPPSFDGHLELVVAVHRAHVALAHGQGLLVKVVLDGLEEVLHLVGDVR
jgi:hypothetical protein